MLLTNQFSNVIYNKVWNTIPMNSLLVINIYVLTVTNLNNKILTILKSPNIQEWLHTQYIF